jgi:hypothetical protein
MGGTLEEVMAKSAPVEVTSQVVEDNIDPTPGIGEVKTYEELYGYFKIPEIDRTPSVVKKVQSIYDWAKLQIKGKDNADLTWEIASLRRKLGSPHMWETPYNQIYQYIKLMGQQNVISKRIKEMELRD